MEVRFVRCKVLKGLFDHEFYVLVNGSSTAYVTQNNVRISKTPGQGEQVDGEVRVYIIDKQAHRTLVEVPGEPVVGGLRTWVSNEMFASA